MDDLTLSEKLAHRAAQIKARGRTPTALIHLRKSVVEKRKSAPVGANPDAVDGDSEKRQLENCLRYCERQGWAAETYSDFAEGHHSGRSDKKRPAWKQLRSQLDRPEVVAVVVEILSRAYRNVRLMLDLLDNELAPRGIPLIVVMLSDVDFSTPAGRSVLISLSNADELMSRMAGETMKAQIASYRQAGRWWGMPPFGTAADVSRGRGYEYRLRRAETGIWWLGEVNRSEFVEGTAEAPPARGALWRGDMDGVLDLYEKFLSEDIGAPSLADYANWRGYRYRNAWHHRSERVPFTTNSVRQVLVSWRIYAGYVPNTNTRKKPTHHYKANFEPLLDPDLLRRVGAKVAQRAFSRQNHRPQKNPPLLLQRVLQCAACGVPYYAQPPGGRTKDYYYHYTVDCASEPTSVRKHPRRYTRAHVYDEAVLADLERLFCLPESVLLEIASRAPKRRAPKVGTVEKMKNRIAQMERGWRALKLSESAIREMKAAVERELLPLNGAAGGEMVGPIADPEPVEIVKRLRETAGLIRRRRKEQPHEANQAIRSMFRAILVNEAGVVEYRPYEWCAPFFRELNGCSKGGDSARQQ